jgi:hypothetical protein
MQRRGGGDRHEWDEEDVVPKALFDFYKMFLVGSECLEEDISCHYVWQYKALLEVLDECPKRLTRVKKLQLTADNAKTVECVIQVRFY